MLYVLCSRYEAAGQMRHSILPQDLTFIVELEFGIFPCGFTALPIPSRQSF